jgi:LuxR family maltose regulon positive regulatory protein
MNKTGTFARPLLSSKLNPPALTSSLVERKKVCERVFTAQSAKLILIRAPAGFGKTTAMVQCRNLLEQNGIRTAWLTLDGSDNDASRFLACLLAAVCEMTGERFPSFEEHSAPPGDIAFDIMERLSSHASAFALLLDDFEYVQDPTVIGLLREIIDKLPRCGQIIIGSRGLPDLGLGRLRARSQLLEIDASQLRFSLDETKEFLARRRHVALSDGEISRLHEKAEGWIAALSLASMALELPEGRSEFISRFSGSNETVADYLASDVLERQSPPLREFLLRTSILRHLNASACDAVLGRSDSAHMLKSLETASLFLVPIGGEEKTYRYHNLFSEFLRTQLAQEYPDELPRLHLAASQWHESHHRPIPAIDHALDGGDHARALRLLTKYAEKLLEEGRLRLLTRWFDAIPAEYLQDSPLLQTIRVWALCYTRGPREALQQLETSNCSSSCDPEVQAHVLALRPAIFAMLDMVEQAYQAGHAAIEAMPPSKPFAESALANEMAYTACFMGRYQETYALLESARRGQGTSVSFFNKMYTESIEGVIDLEAGRLRQATARLRMAVRSPHASAYTHARGNAFAGVFYAHTLYEANDLEQAAHLLHVYVPLARDANLADHIVIGYLHLARIAFERGDIDLVFQGLTELEYIGHQRQLSRIVASAKMERARILLMQGNKQASKDELERANDKEVWLRIRSLHMPAHDLEYHELAAIRWHVHFGDTEEALQKLDAELRSANGSGRHRRALQLSILKSLALHKGGNQDAALSCLRDVLTETCKEGFVRLLIDEGIEVGRLVRQLSRFNEHEAHRTDPIFQEYLQRLINGFRLDDDVEDGLGQTAENVLTEALTPKEIRILLLLAEGYSNSALAEKLFISDSTVRTHLRNINSKLNTHSRSQAVAVARRIGLIR